MSLLKKIAIQSNSLLDYQKGYNNLRDTKILKQGKKINLITQQDTLSGWIPHLEGYLLSALLRPDKALILQNYLRPARLLELSILP